MPYMYILECADGTYYTGSTVNLEKRLWEHENMLGANYTKKKHPVRLVYSEEYARVDEAFYREKQVQGWSHAKKKALIEGEYNKLPELAKNYTQHPRKALLPASARSLSLPKRPEAAPRLLRQTQQTTQVECKKRIEIKPIAEPVEAGEASETNENDQEPSPRQAR
jgi:putative endonuclease